MLLVAYPGQRPPQLVGTAIMQVGAQPARVLRDIARATRLIDAARGLS